jgi:hypothetical protein
MNRFCAVTLVIVAAGCGHDGSVTQLPPSTQAAYTYEEAQADEKALKKAAADYARDPNNRPSSGL